MEKLRTSNIYRNNVKVSVIIPVYNVERYITQCIESVVNQSLSEIEIICVNDGSTDNSQYIVEQYAKVDKRIKLINKSNEGLSAARNDGVSVSSGEYLFFLDSDDYIEKDALNILYTEAKFNNLPVVAFSAEAFCEKENLTDEEFLELKTRTQNVNEWLKRNMVRSNTIVTGQEFLVDMNKNKQYVTVAWLLFVERDFYLSHGIWFPKGVIHEDEFFTLITLLYAKKIKFINHIFYNYRIRFGSIMTNLDIYKSVRSLLYMFKKCLNDLDNINIEENSMPHILSIVSRLANIAYDRYCKLDEKQKSELLKEFALSDRLILGQIAKLRKCQDNINKIKKDLNNTKLDFDAVVSKLKLCEQKLGESNTRYDNISHELKESKSNLEITKAELKETRFILEATKSELKETESNLVNTKISLADLTSNYNITKENFSKTHARLNATKSKLEETEKILSSNENKFDELQFKYSIVQKDLHDTVEKLSVSQNNQKLTEERLCNTKAELKKTSVSLETVQEQLKDTNLKLTNIKNTLKNTEKHLKDVKSGLSFRIGRIITWLPRKIMGRK